MNTLCHKCFFAQTYDSGKACFFNIPDIVKDTHKVEVHDNYYKIKNYICKYGIDKKIYDENIEKFYDLDIVEYVKAKNIVSYSLSLICHDSSASNVLENINSLSIKPNFIFVICNNSSISKNLSNKLSQNSPYIKFKVHDFLDKEMMPERCLHVALETNKNNMGNMMWIIDNKDFDVFITNDSIQNINYMINVEQKPAHYYKHSTINSQFSGIFINSNNYWALSKNTKYEIENNEHTIVLNYD
jgi:hypothetical protein